MKLSASYTIGATRDKVFSAITDPSVLRRCIAGCETMVKTGEDRDEAQQKSGTAGLKASYSGKVQERDQKPPEPYTLLIEGKAAPDYDKGPTRIQLGDRSEKADLHCEADA